MTKKSLSLQDIDLVKLKKFLKHGDIKKISEITGYSTNYVSRVLSPIDKRMNREIVQNAIKCAEQSQEVFVDPDLAKNITT